jgi:hypothetical protein
MIKWQGLFFMKLGGDKTAKICGKKQLKMAKKFLVVLLLYKA